MAANFQDIVGAGNAALAAQGDAQKQGIELATMADKVQADKLAIQKQQQELENSKFNTVTGMLTTLSKSNPKIARMILPKVRERFRTLGVPVDDAVLESYASDEEHKNKWLRVQASLAKGATPEVQADGMASLNDLIDNKAALDSYLDNIKNNASLDRAEIMAKYQANRDDARFANQERSQENKDIRAEERQVKKEDRTLRRELDTAEKALEEQILQLDEVKKKFETFSKQSNTGGTGAISQLGGLRKYIDSDTEGLDSAFKNTSLQSMVKMFAGMSKAVDSTAERRAFEATQPNVALDDSTNRDILITQIKNAKRLLDKTRKAKARFDKEGSFENLQVAGDAAASGNALVPIDDETELLARARDLLKRKKAKNPNTKLTEQDAINTLRQQDKAKAAATGGQ